MKILIFILVILVAKAEDFDDFSLESEGSEEASNFFRITGGQRPGFRKVPSYVGLKIYYDSGTRNCGGFLGPAADRVITAARCVFDASEGKTNKIRFAFGQSPFFRRNKFNFKDIYRLSTFNASSNTSADDLAVILLNNAVRTSRRIAGATPSTEATEDYYVGDNLYTCGFGDIDNYRNRTRRLRCTTLRVVPVAECATPTIPGTICTKNIDSRNACGGDIGSPTYTNFSGNLQAVGVISFYPDSRPNARCQDGHMAILTQLGNFQTFLANPTTVGTNLS